MGIYENQVLPRAINKLLDNPETRRYRSRVVPRAVGRVLELGFGGGTNLGFYSSAVTEVLAVDPAVVGQSLAARAIEESGIEVTFIGLDGQAIDIEDSSVDSAVSTWTLCTIPDPELALAEVHRALRPGGEFLFIEHGLHDDPSVARTQRRIEPVWTRFTGGCKVTRPMADMIRGSDLELIELEETMMAGPSFSGFTSLGVARRPS